MTMILNKQPEPPPSAPAHAPPVIDRRGLEHADRSLRSVLFFVRAVLVLLIILAILMAGETQGKSLLLILGSFIPWLLIEAGIIAARACVASAWALRKPDGQP